MAGGGERPYLEGSEPHEPVEAVVVRGDEAWPSPQVARLALELVVLPHSLWCTGVGAGRALQDDLCALLGDAVGETESGLAGLSTQLPAPSRPGGGRPSRHASSAAGTESRSETLPWIRSTPA